jgi:hypothetical protein
MDSQAEVRAFLRSRRVMFAPTTVAGSPTEERVQLLGSLAATHATGDPVKVPTPTS